LIYPYLCRDCSLEFEIIKSHVDIELPECCPSCGKIGVRTISKHQMIDKSSANDWNMKSYNPAFGEALTPSEAKKLAKERGLTEVGNEDPNKISKHFEEQRNKREKDFNDSINLNLGEIK